MTDKNMKPSWYSIQARGKTADIAIRGVIGEPKEWGGSGDAAQFAEDLKAVYGADTVNVSLHSPGGSVFDGIAITNQLRQVPGEIIMTVEGLAASMGSYILTAADEVRIPANAYVMIHNPWAIAVGDAEEMKKMADQLEMMAGDMAAEYAGYTGNTKEDVAAWMRDTTWMNGTTAVERGFAHTLLEPVRMAAVTPEALALFDTMRVSMPSNISSKTEEEAAPTTEETVVEPVTETTAEHDTPSTTDAKGWLERAVQALTGARQAKEDRDAIQSKLDEANATIAALRAEVDVVAELKQKLDEAERNAVTTAQATVAAVAALGIPASSAPAVAEEGGDILETFMAITDSAERTRFYRQHHSQLRNRVTTTR